jgi:hypothetical protein
VNNENKEKFQMNEEMNEKKNKQKEERRKLERMRELGVELLVGWKEIHEILASPMNEQLDIAIIQKKIQKNPLIKSIKEEMRERYGRERVKEETNYSIDTGL